MSDIEGTAENMFTEPQESATLAVGSRRELVQLIANGGVPILVDFWAPWCGPCRTQAPIVEELAREAGNRVKVLSVNVDELGTLAVEYGIRSIPTLMVFRDGRPSARLVGVQSLETLRQATGLS